jgi:hypothetical protein
MWDLSIKHITRSGIIVFLLLPHALIFMFPTIVKEYIYIEYLFFELQHPITTSRARNSGL